MTTPAHPVFRLSLLTAALLLAPASAWSWTPRLLSEPERAQRVDLSDFSEVGYHQGAKKPPYRAPNIFSLSDFGAEPGSDRDMAPALQAAVDAAAAHGTLAIIELAPGSFSLKQPVYVRHRGVIIRGSGSGTEGTRIILEQPADGAASGLHFAGRPEQDIDEAGLEHLQFVAHAPGIGPAVTFRFTRNSWARNLAFKSLEAGVRVERSRELTLNGLTFDGPVPLRYPVFLEASEQVLVRDLASSQPAPLPFFLAPGTRHAVFTGCRLVLAPPHPDPAAAPSEHILLEDTRLTVPELMEVDPDSWSYAEPSRYAYYPLLGPEDSGSQTLGRHHVLWNVELDFPNQETEGKLELNVTDPQVQLIGAGSQEQIRVVSLFPRQSWILSLPWRDGDYVEGMNRRTNVHSLHRHQLNLRLRAPGAWKGGFVNDTDELIEQSRKLIQKQHPGIMPAWMQLREAADEALEAPIRYVTEKDFYPPSGDKRDYISIGVYWWPNPETEDGLPYVVKDGVRNPERLEYDAPRFRETQRRIRTLSLVYTLSGREAYAARATELLHHWFLHPEHGMNPNFRFGQSIPGRVEGRGIGILESRDFAFMQDIAAALKDSPHFTPPTQEGLKSWFADYLDWIWNHRFGGDERIHPNNHGSAYDPIVAGLALYTGDEDLARRTFLEARRLRIDAHFKQDGRQPQELWRTLSFAYSRANLANIFQTAVMAQKLGIDLFDYRGPDGQNLKTALEFLIPFALGDAEWPYEQIREMNPEPFYFLLLRAAWHLQDERFLEQARRLREQNPELAAHPGNLLYPLLIEGMP